MFGTVSADCGPGGAMAGAGRSLAWSVSRTVPDGTLVWGPSGRSALNSASVAMVDVPAKIACITRICRRRAAAESISGPWVVDGLLVILYLCASLLAAAWLLVIDLLCGQRRACSDLSLLGHASSAMTFDVHADLFDDDGGRKPESHG